MFKDFSPAQLRLGIEREMRRTDDPIMASNLAIINLKNNPLHYEEMQKARITKYIKRVKGKDGKWIYEYPEDLKKQKRKNSEEIRLKMIFDSQDIFFNYNLIGFEERIGKDETSNFSSNEAKSFESNILNDNKEHSAIIDDLGNIIFTKTGNYDEIQFEKNEIEKMRKVEILTHNHPEDKSFSVEDVFLALSLGIKELRVKTPIDVCFFKISHKNKSRNTNELSNKNKLFMTVLIDLNKKITQNLRVKVKNKELNQKEAEKEHRDLLWEMVKNSQILSDVFNIEYGKVNK